MKVYCLFFLDEPTGQCVFVTQSANNQRAAIKRANRKANKENALRWGDKAAKLYFDAIWRKSVWWENKLSPM